MKYYIIMHHHRFGCSTHLAKSGHYPTHEDCIKLIEDCDEEFEEDREEWIEVVEAAAPVLID